MVVRSKPKFETGVFLLKSRHKQQEDSIDLLTLLIEKWDEDHNTSTDADPIELLRYLMNENKLKFR